MRIKCLLAALIVVILTAMNSTVGKAQTAPSAQLTANYPEVNVRLGPGTNYPPFTRIQNDNTAYPIIGRHGGWWLISGEDGRPLGWVSVNFVTATNIKGVPVIGTCAYPYHIALECPISRDTVKLTYQPFEHGFMRSESGTISVYYDNCSMQYCLRDYFQDKWLGETLPRLNPPPGLQQPTNGFGKVWLDNKLLNAAYPRTLGWATAGETVYTSPVETVYTSPVEIAFASPHGFQVFFCLPQGQIIAQGFVESSLWRYVNRNKGACHW